MLKFIGINKEKEKYLPNKKYISGTDEKVCNMVAKCLVHKHNTA